MRSRLARRGKMLLLALVFLGWTGISAAPGLGQQEPPQQESQQPPEEERIPLQVGNYDISGTVSFGNRFVDVGGSRAKYNELLNLHQGFRVFDTQLEVLRSEPNRGWFDRAFISAQSLGGDPFPVIRFEVRKNGLYELRTGYRATQYVFDLPQTALTPNRGWSDRRRFADAELRYTPFQKVRFRFFYNRTQRDGQELSSGPFFYFPLAPSLWGAFGRADSTAWIIPLREEANLYGGGMDFRFGKTDVHLEQSYRTYNNPANMKGAFHQPIRLLGPQSPSQDLVITRWNAFAGFNIPMTTIRVDQEITSWLRLRAGYLYSHASGPTSLDGSVLVPLSPTLGANRNLDFAGAGATKMTSHTADFGFTLKLLESLDLLSDYRYQTFSETGRQFLRATASDFPLPLPLGEDTQRWDYGQHTLDTLLAFVPFSTLSVRAGVRFFKQDVVRQVNGSTAPGTRRSWFYTPVLEVSWKPSSKLRVSGELEHRTAVDPYVRISPEGTVGSNLRVRFSPSSRWGIDNTFSFRNRETDLLQYRIRTRANSTALWVQPREQFRIHGGFTYSSFFSRNSIAYLRGAAPLTGLLSLDQAIDRSVFGGIRAGPLRNLTVTFSGQFIRSTGTGNFTGETTTYGPLTWPSWNAAIAYQIKDVGRLLFDWQHSYYLENLSRATDFTANAFTLRWEISF